MADNFVTNVAANGGEAPMSIMWMPAGTHTISATIDRKPGRYTVHATEGCVERLNAALTTRKEGEGLKPVIFFDHKRGRAAAYPDRFEWGKNQEGKEGIMLHLTRWTPTGKAMVEGGEYNGFSPAFVVDEGGNPIDLPHTTAEIGSLTNEPAFKENAHIAAMWNAEAELRPEYREIAAAWQFEKTTSKDKEETTEKNTDMKAIAEKLGLDQNATESEVLAAIEALQDMKTDNGTHEIQASLDAANEELEETKKSLEAANKKYDELVDKTGNAMIQAAIEEGRIPAKNEELISTLKTTFKNDPAAAQTILAAYKPQQDFHFGEKKDDKDKKKKNLSDYCQEECDELSKNHK